MSRESSRRGVNIRRSGVSLQPSLTEVEFPLDCGPSVVLREVRGSRAGTESCDAVGSPSCLIDYRGYGGNPGSPSEEGVARRFDAAVAGFGERGFPAHRTIYFGESLGTGVVAPLHSRHRPAGIVRRPRFIELAELGEHHHRRLS